ncbi:MAG: hypothetical protein SP4CHLAM5_08800 [Chlamydiia bacterium]|nr:hypothetical protein [Chlamydiia bacterium]MCH9618743.1 hypothetical protein [Chlamydiia bacterium]MCH9624517.1 hypothetical protein [Chlamydiia bacterium]
MEPNRPCKISYSQVLGCKEQSFPTVQEAFSEATRLRVKLSRITFFPLDGEICDQLLKTMYKLRDATCTLLNTRPLESELYLRTKVRNVLFDANEMCARALRENSIADSSLDEIKEQVDDLLRDFLRQNIPTKTPATAPTSQALQAQQTADTESSTSPISPIDEACTIS